MYSDIDIRSSDGRLVNVFRYPEGEAVRIISSVGFP